jgi:hypothetical protein
MIEFAVKTAVFGNHVSSIVQPAALFKVPSYYDAYRLVYHYSMREGSGSVRQPNCY